MAARGGARLEGEKDEGEYKGENASYGINKSHGHSVYTAQGPWSITLSQGQLKLIYYYMSTVLTVTGIIQKYTIHL